MFLKSFEYYRGIAIVLIVIGHCYGLSDWTFSSYPERVLANIITGGTALFVFISGFLFHQVFYPRFKYGRFMSKKLQKVFVPYLLWSALALTFTFATRAPLPANFVGPGTSLFDQWLRPIALSLVTGGHFLAYWYIPFIMIIFLLSPIFIRFIQLERVTQVKVMLAVLICSALVQRPVNNILVVQSVLFFSPIYLFGILCSIDRDWIYEHFKNKAWLLALGVLALAMIQSTYYMGAGSYHKPPFILHAFDINIIQKFVLCLLGMVMLHRYEERESKILSALAASSFAIFFIHGWMVKGLFLIKSWYPFTGGLWLLPLITALVIAGSYMIATLIKKLFPKHSAMIIGW